MSPRRLLCLVSIALLTASGVGCQNVTGVAASLGYTPGAIRTCMDFPTPFRDSWLAVQQSLTDLQLHVDSEKHNGSNGTITSRTQGGEVITVRLVTQPGPIPIDGVMTRICVQVGTFGHQQTNDRIMAKIVDRLTPPQQPQTAQPAVTVQPPVPSQPAKPGETQVQPIILGATTPTTLRSNGQ